MNRTLIAVLVFAGWSAAMFGSGWAWRGDRAERDTSTAAVATTKESLAVEQQARSTEHQQAAAAQSAGDAADTREKQIDEDFDERLAAAVAGRDSELGRLRKQWAGCETSRLSDAAGAAAEAAEEDRLRRASAARIVRAVELAQSERDECVDRYGALSTEAPEPR